MKERPILFSAPMVVAILAGRKTQTRRIVKPQPVKIIDGIPYRNVFEGDGLRSERRIVGTKVHRSPYGKTGDRLWVRETFLRRAAGAHCVYRADMDPVEAAGFGAMYGGWKPSIFMPRAASRITLEVAGVRVERLQEISDKDAAAEGVLYASGDFDSNRGAYRALWESINGLKSWYKNPWVWVIEFRRVAP